MDTNYKKELVAYVGSKFQIEWYVRENGNIPALEYFNDLTKEEQAKTFALFQLLANAGVIRDKAKFNFEGNKIYAFKPKPHRFLCFFFKGKKIIITNGFVKKQDKLPLEEKKKALKYYEDFEDRNKKGNYYL